MTIPPYPKPVSKSKKLYQKGFLNTLKTIFYLNKSGIHGTCESTFDKNVIFDFDPPTFTLIGLREEVNSILDNKKISAKKSVVVNNMLKPLLRESIFNTNGDIWQKYRNIMSKGLNTIHTKKTFPIMLDVVKTSISKYEVGKEINIEDKMTNITADIIFRTILSSELSLIELNKFIDDFTEFQKTFVKSYKFKILGLNFLEKKLNKLGEDIRKVIDIRVNKRYDEIGQNSIDDTLGEFIKSSLSNEELNISKDEMVDQICMLFLAGHETSAAALSWSFYLLALDQGVQEKVYEEIVENIGDRDIEFDDLNKLTLTSAVFFEAMRLYPPVYILPREKSTKCPVSNKTTKKEHYIINNWVIHRNSKYWEDPNSFCPQRFVDKKYSEYTKEGSYLPFAKGSRACIGKAFAIQEGIITIAEIIRKYKVLEGKNIPKPYGSLTLRSRKGIKVVLEKRV